MVKNGVKSEFGESEKCLKLYSDFGKELRRETETGKRKQFAVLIFLTTVEIALVYKCSLIMSLQYIAAFKYLNCCSSYFYLN